MAYTCVTNTKNGTKAIKQALSKTLCNLYVTCNNSHPDYILCQMQSTWLSYNKEQFESVQIYKIVQSFGLDELDPKDSDDIEKANNIGLELAQEMYDDRQSLIITRADGDGGKLYNIILINSVDFIDGKSLGGTRTGWSNVAAVSDTIIQRYGLVPTPSKISKDHRTMGEIKKAARGEYVWKDDLKQRISDAVSNVDIVDEDSFKDSMMANFEVDVRYNGKGLSYSFMDADGEKKVIRASRLGSNYGRDTLANKFVDNKSKK